MDSLIAVEIRSWFLKELSVDVPVLEILNGGSARTLLRNIRDLVITSMGLQLEAGDEAADPVSAPVEAPALEALVVASLALPPAVATPANVMPAAEKMQPVLSTIAAEDPSDSADTTSEGTGSSERLTTMPPTLYSASVYTPDSPVSEMVKLGPESAVPGTLSPQDPIERSIPVSFGQSRFWFLKHFLPNQSAFNI
ncbi:hypothetical protein GGR58DRAFT_360228 [Xylaria digitata]|nr:hypothetical protein GGR58DRAFT_360228 [Xylaria digitata]